MNDVDGATDWRQLREFAAVDLTESFLLSCTVEYGTLFVDVDLYLDPEHPFYEKPRPKQKVCNRPAVIEFPYCEAITVDGISVDAGPAEVARRIGHGAITGFRRLADARYELLGEFGALLIESERPLLRLKGP